VGSLLPAFDKFIFLACWDLKGVDQGDMVHRAFLSPAYTLHLRVQQTSRVSEHPLPTNYREQFGQEENKIYMPDASYEQFVNGQQGS